MILLDLFYLSIKNLFRRSLRSWLTITGIVIGIAALVSLLSITENMKSSIEDVFLGIGVNKLIVSSERAGSLSSLLASSGEGFTSFEIRGMENLNGVDKVIPAIRVAMHITYKERTITTTVVGIPTNIRIEELGYSLYEGRGFSLSDDNKCNAVLGYYIAKKSFPEEISVGDIIYINNTKCRVIGIISSTGGFGIENFEVYIPMSTMQNQFGYKSIRFAYVIASDVSLAKEEISKFLNQTRKGFYTIVDMGQILQSFIRVINIVSFVLLAIASIALLVSAIGIMNTMYMAVIERTREIGILKVLGAKNYEIALIFLFESGLIGFIGGILGSIFGILIAGVIDFFSQSSFTFRSPTGVEVQIPTPTVSYLNVNPLHIVFAISLATVVGMLSGLAPALYAARQDPIVALRTE